ncbi:DUF262 domain-containing protein [Acinetobacter johnsonii]|jgi:hypothetical protein|uniref:DUF262 domain-containing protein n=1 Tax=Acinetobacter johnsonii TaxID=40214 RepID=UPI0024475FF4|nr:DUF262 domain-containing protein [Acinetobacter johnsonii]MDH1727394.1 DUF262 domain-containing protein [Acinetobacter johnsonii]
MQNTEISSKSELNDKLAKLDKELNDARKEIKTQKLSMSIGELCSLFKKKEIVLNPNFQRVFRWDINQQSRLIESILLGIPLPPIFIAQQANAKWTVVDGLQRLSTLFNIEGLLEFDQEDSIKHVLNKKHEIIEQDDEFLDVEEEIEEILQVEEHLQLFHFSGLKKITELNGLTWQQLPLDYRRIVRRSFFDINIIFLENNTKAQYELFQRLNTGGSALTPQEVRNCIIIMNDINFFNQIDNYRLNTNFIKITNLTIKQMQEAYDMELINRFIISINYDQINFNNYPYDTKISDFIDNETLELLDNPDFKIDNAILLLQEAINFLYETIGINTFKKYNTKNQRFYGSFNLSAFEAVLIGIAINLDKIKQLEKNQIEEKIKDIYAHEDYLYASGRGIKVLNRFEKLIKFSKEYFSE